MKSPERNDLLSVPVLNGRACRSPLPYIRGGSNAQNGVLLIHFFVHFYRTFHRNELRQESSA